MPDQLPAQPAPKKRPRHLMDPNNLQRETIRSRDNGPMHLEPVQKWVLSALAFTTIIHLSVGLVIGAMFISEDRMDARVGLNVIAAAFGVLAVAAARAIHQKALFSWWLLIGIVPGVVGLVLVLR
ncbi:hypothetical protein [Nocardioides mangrovi]|uniref:DUF2537 domain-containing protein n=1 Tax=Nocardioides mangrovi TaxID=2874580 RepID=A0ABS7UD15_9ACTN|nr:hypothetical protein [Nocardioides mangrovi]MBZ5738881.1 hypothetical protein [Nocardioides mangrovi]